MWTFFVLAAVVYLLLAFALLFWSRRLIFPTGNVNVHERWLWNSGGTRLMYYFQGNTEVPSPDTPVVAHFMRHGWDVAARGYSDSVEINERDALEYFDALMAKGYTEVAVVARSIGACFAPYVLQSTQHPTKVRFILYITPVPTLGEVVNWHTFSAFRPLVDRWLAGADRGFRAHRSVKPTHVIVAEHDRVVPNDRLDPAVTPVVIHRAGHNDLDASSEFQAALDDITK